MLASVSYPKLKVGNNISLSFKMEKMRIEMANRSKQMQVTSRNGTTTTGCLLGQCIIVTGCVNLQCILPSTVETTSKHLMRKK